MSQEGEITAPIATQGAVTVSTTGPKPCLRSPLSVIADQLQRIGHIGSYRMRGSTNPVCIDLERQNIFSVPELDEIPLGLDSNTSKKRKSYI